MSESAKEISLRDIFRLAILHWGIVLGSAGCAFALACVYAIFATPVYTATVTVQPKTEPSGLGGSLGRLAGQLGGLSSMAGLSLGGADDKEKNYMAVLKSNELALQFIDKFDLMPKLFPSRWNPVLHRWNGDDPSLLSNLRLWASREVARLSGDQGWHPPSAQPTSWQAVMALKRILEVKNDRETGMVKVSMKLHDPVQAAAWANEYVALANSKIRNRTVDESTTALKYLDEQAKDTDISELKMAISSLIQQRLEEIVSAKSRPDFAFQIIDSAMVPQTRSSPKRLLIIVLATLIGGTGGLMFVLIRESGGLS